MTWKAVGGAHGFSASAASATRRALALAAWTCWLPVCFPSISQKSCHSAERNVNCIAKDAARRHKRVSRCRVRGAIAGTCFFTVWSRQNVITLNDRLQMLAEMLSQESRAPLIRELLIRMVSDVGYDARCSVLISRLCRVRTQLRITCHTGTGVAPAISALGLGSPCTATSAPAFAGAQVLDVDWHALKRLEAALGAMLYKKSERLRQAEKESGDDPMRYVKVRLVPSWPRPHRPPAPPAAMHCFRKRWGGRHEWWVMWSDAPSPVPGVSPVPAQMWSDVPSLAHRIETPVITRTRARPDAAGPAPAFAPPSDRGCCLAGWAGRRGHRCRRHPARPHWRARRARPRCRLRCTRSGYPASTRARARANPPHGFIPPADACGRPTATTPAHSSP